MHHAHTYAFSVLMAKLWCAIFILQECWLAPCPKFRMVAKQFSFKSLVRISLKFVAANREPNAHCFRSQSFINQYPLELFNCATVLVAHEWRKLHSSMSVAFEQLTNPPQTVRILVAAIYLWLFCNTSVELVKSLILNIMKTWTNFHFKSSKGKYRIEGLATSGFSLHPTHPREACTHALLMMLIKGLASFNQEISWKLPVFHPGWKCLPTCGCMILRHPCVQDLIHC